uniref:Uncharacterized protein n=1 Tax=Candidatus Kentrum sp. LFY TaxID=2126342 RepID=A0A450WZJ3_9GAMM|nr:MAG: hypothetical protein BECKLFY1418C_GA0070996_111910 [Candidatus Kentron sp. LFY]
MWADFEAGLDLGFNLGAIAGKSNLDTDLEMVVPGAIRAGEHFTIDTSKWTYDVANGAGFELDDSNWGLNANLVLAGSVGVEMEVGLMGKLKGLPKVEASVPVVLQVNPNVNLDLLGIGGIPLGEWELSTSSRGFAIEKGDKEISLNAPELAGVESDRNGSSFSAERDADSNLLNANLDLVNMVTSMFPELSPLNTERKLINKKFLKADLTAKLVSLDFNAGLGYGEEINMDYDPTKMDLTLAFGGQTQTGKLGDSFRFLAPDDKSATNLQVDFGYDGKIQAERNLNLNGALKLGVGTIGVDFKVKGWGPSFSAGPALEVGPELSVGNIGIGSSSKSLAFRDTANIAMAYA